jgi:D-aminopeptidase
VPEERKRLRELGLRVGRFATGSANALVDVPGVRVGHRTLVVGDSVRTGVTAVLPHGGNPYAEKVLGACHVVNGYGKAAGLSQLAELGTLESPILLTSTVAVGAAWEGGLRHIIDENPEVAGDRDTVNVVVGECYDGWLSDARSMPLRPEHALDAIAGASEHEAAEGSVGAGTGTTCFGFKAGIGTASRVSDTQPALRLGCLVVANFGAPRDLHVLVGEAAAGEYGGDVPDHGGSIMAVLATDAPLSERQLRRLAARAGLGLGRAGSFATNGSGEYAIAFSTAQRVPHRSDRSAHDFRFLRDDSVEMRQLFEMAAEATHEALLGSLCSAGPMSGRDDHSVEAIPYELLRQAPRLVPAG